MSGLFRMLRASGPNTAVDLIGPDVARAADRINASWGKSIEAIIATGQMLLDYQHRWHNQEGKWSRLIGANQYADETKYPRLLRFGKSHATRLTTIARVAETLYPHGGILPSDTHTLAMLGTMIEERPNEFAKLLKDGKLTPELTRSDLQLIVKSH